MDRIGRQGRGVVLVELDQCRHQGAAVGVAGGEAQHGGVVESALAGALGITLGGTNRYGERVEHRPTMGDGPAPVPADIPRATELATHVGVVTALATAVLVLVRRVGRR